MRGLEGARLVQVPGMRAVIQRVSQASVEVRWEGGSMLDRMQGGRLHFNVIDKHRT